MRPQPCGCGNSHGWQHNSFCGFASMRPQPCGCGNLYNVFHKDVKAEGFNEAAAVRLRKSKQQIEQVPFSLASMRPQPCGCGNAHARMTLAAKERASMRPQPCGCGNLASRGIPAAIIGLQ